MSTGKLLITGGSGFIGTNAVAYFVSKGWDVLNIAKDPPKDPSQSKMYRECNICDRDSVMGYFRDFKPEYVIHLAARTDLNGKVLQDYDPNITGTQNVVDATNEVGTVKRALYASTRLVFKMGYQHQHDYDYKATTVYGMSKIETERIVKAQPEGSVPWMLFRPTSIWGEWFDVPYKTFFLCIAKSRYLHPTGMAIPKHFGYVGNAVYEFDRYLHAPLEQVNGKVYFIADFDPIDVLKFGQVIQRAMNAPPIRQVPYGLLKAVALGGDLCKLCGYAEPPLSSFRLENIITPLVFDLSREREICGELPYNTEAAVERTVKWMRDSGQI
jgi:nucleoside-diphosphate-sugar epimerase